MPCVVAVDALDRVRDVVERGKTEQPLAGRQDVAESGFLRDDGAAAGKVTGAAIAEPPAPQPDILVFGDGEFAARPSDVRAVRRQIETDRDGVARPPAM